MDAFYARKMALTSVSGPVLKENPKERQASE
jgi:hypothetical protein